MKLAGPLWRPIDTTSEICHSVTMQWASPGIPKVQRVIGLMSGTSADGVDAALVEIQDNSPRPVIRVLAHATYPYEAALRAQILAASYPPSSSVDLICHLNVALGECFATAAIAVAHTAGLPLDQIDLIGSHGQTIYHMPEASTTPPWRPSTLQIGEPCVIAERTGNTTVADFRLRDMAAGGLGAPLAPYGHHLLFAEPHRPKLVQNIGGIANVTVLADADMYSLLAFDTGPGNMLIDEALRHCTCTAFTAASILDNYHRFIWPRWTITEVIICGGGVYNTELMRLLRDGLAPCAVTTPETYGYPNEALEAILFALLAHATVHGRPGNVPGATGARRTVVLGKIVPA